MGYTHHDGISIYGSGLAVGKKNEEALIVDKSGVIQSTVIHQSVRLSSIQLTGGSGLTCDTTYVINTSGYVANGQLTMANGTAGLKIAGGTTGFSGWQSTAYSTPLTSITYARADSMVPRTGLGALVSGFPCLIKVDFSGHMIDFTSYYVGSGATVTTSCGVSSKIAWFAIGT